MSTKTKQKQKPRLQLSGKDGNAFAILGRARRAAVEAGWSEERWEEVRVEATSGNYDHLLQTIMRHFDVD